MASRLSDGAIRLSNGRIIYADTPIFGADLVEIIAFLTPSAAWPFVSGGGGSVGPQGPSGPAAASQGSQGPQGAVGAQGPQGASGTQGTQGPQGANGTGGATLYTSTGGSTLGANQTRYLGVGVDLLDANETHVQLIITSAATLQNLTVKAITNTRADDTTVTVRVNGAPTAISVTIPAGSTAVFQDLVNSVAVVPGDLVAIELATGGSGGNFGCTASLEINS